MLHTLTAGWPQYVIVGLTCAGQIWRTKFLHRKILAQNKAMVKVSQAMLSQAVKPDGR